MIIYDIREKGKNWLVLAIQRYFLLIMLILLGSLVFGAIKLIHIEKSHIPVTIEYTEEHAYIQATTTPVISNSSPKAQQEPQTKLQSGMYVASRGGTSYYLPTCAEAKRISDKNKIWLPSKALAEQLGYKPAKSCKELQVK